MLTHHHPVLVDEVLKFLDPKKNQNFVDCTVGSGGHAEKILARTGPKGRLLGLDWDGKAIERSRERLSEFKNRAVLVQSSYINLKQIAYGEGFLHINGVLLDLGLSSDQLQASGRGFSFQVNEPLDMRFCQEENGLTAADILNNWPADRLAGILKEYADEPFAKKIAQAVAKYRKQRKIETTLELVKIIIDTIPMRKRRIHPATKTFQALRIAVNNELNNVKIILKDLLELLEPGARVAVITFHSTEDRIVKQFFKQESKDCLCPKEIPVCRCEHKARLKLITKKPIAPSANEVSENFRSRSAKLRVVEKF